MDSLKVGDIVVLKTGGPRMTVLKAKKKTCLCAFFINDSLNTLKVPIGSLENVTSVKYDESTAIPDKLESFTDQVRERDEENVSELVDESTMTVLTTYIKEDQPAILARIERSSINVSQEDLLAVTEQPQEGVQNG